MIMAHELALDNRPRYTDGQLLAFFAPFDSTP
jgi:hypothetical protein